MAGSRAGTILPVSLRHALVRVAAASAACFAVGCERAESGRVQGYVEGEYVYVASPLAGELEKLAVKRGDVVKPGQLLFQLESGSEKAARDLEERRLAEARANLDDARKGKRPSEIESMEAQLRQAKAELALAEQELARQEQLVKTSATAVTDYDKAVSAREQARQRVAQLDADLATARLGQRADLLVAAEEQVKAREAALAKAQWDLSQKSQYATQEGPVFDTLYQEGEWVAAGRPVVAQLPPRNVKVRAFVQQARVAAIRVSDPVRVFVDGVVASFAGRVTFVSPQVEYTPPVIFSRESREKLVFMVEARFDDATAAQLKPGQPVDVEFAR